ncbi:MAG: hypothetical protein AB7O59_21975 [Pirellulales bacterium]
MLPPTHRAAPPVNIPGPPIAGQNAAASCAGAAVPAGWQERPPALAACNGAQPLVNGERFDIDRFAQVARNSFVSTPPDPPIQDVTLPVSPRCMPLLPAMLPGGGPLGSLRGDVLSPVDSRWSLVPARAQPIAPTGTMYLWNMVRGTAGSDAPHARTNPSAGVVLTRPPGVYSLDWVGIAITAPLR